MERRGVDIRGCRTGFGASLKQIVLIAVRQKPTPREKPQGRMRHCAIFPERRGARIPAISPRKRFKDDIEDVVHVGGAGDEVEGRSARRVAAAFRAVLPLGSLAALARPRVNSE